jgi:hypothetical protein
MAVPPVLVGGAQLTVSTPGPPGLAVTDVGAVATVDGVADVIAGTPAPASFTALTRAKMTVPFARPVIVTVSVLAGRSEPYAAHVEPSLLVSTRYPLTVPPPESAGATHVRVAWLSPITVVRLRGLPAIVTAVAVTVAWSPAPTLVTAATRK